MADIEMKITISNAKLGAVFTRLQSIYDMSEELDLNNVNLFLLKVDEIPAIRAEFVTILDRVHELNLTANPSKYKVDYKKLIAFDDMADKILSRKVEANSTLRTQQLLTGASTDPADSGLKLPRINLIPFDGRVENWASFHQMFETYVHKRRGISNLERLNLLVNNLTGSAKSIIKGILLSAENYDIIYRTLVNRYQDKQELANYYLNIIMNFKPLTQESEKGLNLFLEQVVDSVAALKLVGIPELFDFFLIFLSSRKLDPETFRRFEMEYRTTDVPTFAQLTDFIRSQARILGRNKAPVKSSFPKKPAESKTTHTYMAQNSAPTEDFGAKNSNICPLCQTPRHPLYRCEVFRTMTPYKRFLTTKKHKFCLNCLGFSHGVSECPSEGNCSAEGCNRKHHSLLHFKTRASSSSQSDDSNQSPADPQGGSPNSTIALATSSCPASIVLLSTAQVVVKDRIGNPQFLRVLLDTGSMSHFISRRACEKLGLSRFPVNTTVKCLGRGSAQIKEKSIFSFSSRVDPKVVFKVEALVMDELMDLMPSVPVSLENYSHLNGIVLADPSLNVPGPVDMIVGATLIPHLLLDGKIVGPLDSPVALNSSLGWIIMGAAPLNSKVTSACLSVENSLENILQKFWALEEIPKTPSVSEDDKACEEHFLKHYRRESDGSFVVALPFKHQPELLGDSLKSATSKFFSLENRLIKDEKLYQQYRDVFNNHIALGHFALASNDRVRTNKPFYYMPHHGVTKTESSSTPLRIVLNASAPSSTKFSLNDLLFVGPKLQTNIFEVLLNFRLFRYALSADAKQMYLQIKIQDSDRQFQRLLWRPSRDQPLKIYEITRVAFGVCTSPYLAQKCVRILADENRDRYPSGAISIERDTYVDNVSSSVSTESELLSLHSELTSIFEAGRFTLAKWCSNSPKLMEQIPNHLRMFEPHDFDTDSTSSILGLIWNPVRDTFAVKVNPPPDECTKRKMTSVIAKIFDPLGLLSPLTVLAKEMIRSLWTAEADWDDAPPDHIRQKWANFVSELECLASWSTPRHSGLSTHTKSQLIGFSDASQLAYGGVIYLRTEIDDFVVVRLLCAKAKVAPVQVQTINRLELSASVLLSKLIKSVLSTYHDRFRFDRIYALSDSQVALQWIISSPARWKTFVANRVSQIQENVDSTLWYHVTGPENAADCLSRGLSAKALIEHPTWFEGPEWLKEPEDQWPIRKIIPKVEPKFPEHRSVSLVVQSATSMEWCLKPLLDRVSSYTKLIRTTVRVLRFTRNSTTRAGLIQPFEMDQAEKLWLINVQLEHFPAILDYLRSSNRMKKKKSPHQLIARLGLFIEDGLIRVGGRLQNANVPFDQRHPVLLPSGGRFLELLVDHYHENNLHTGPTLMMALIQKRFWILSGRNFVRKRFRLCNVCFKINPKPLHPKMAPLPTIRVQPAKPFLHTGVDYAGPFGISWTRRRGAQTIKAYICLFVCLSVKAVHLELVSSLSTPCFLAAFKRFLSRRGPCKIIQSDQGTNFIGARSVLRELYGHLNSRGFNTEINNELTRHGVEWKLNPPSAPHFGGVWESQVKCVKTHLSRVIGTQILTYEEFNTVLVQIEALLNSRPLCALTEDVSAPKALTPAHFLTVGSTLEDLPAEDFINTPINRLDRYELIDSMVQHFWKRWHTEYLSTLQKKYKWTEDTPPPAPGTIVIILRDKNQPSPHPLQWPVGIIVQTMRGPDGTIRVAKVKTASGEYTRPLVKLCPLPRQ